MTTPAPAFHLLSSERKNAGEPTAGAGDETLRAALAAAARPARVVPRRRVGRSLPPA